MTPSQAVEHYGSQTAAAEAWGIPRTTFRDILTRSLEDQYGGGGLTFEALPASTRPIEDIIETRRQAWRHKHDHAQAAQWQTVSIPESLPYGIVLMGDCHLDDDGCNWDELLRDIALMRDTQGCYTINVGDYTNNWVGSLQRLYGEQDASKQTARRLIEWLLIDSGVTWAAVVLGNHDQWQEGGEIIRQMVGKAKVEIPVHEWTAKLEFVTPNGSKCRINASHDFKGKNMWNVTHGPLREAVFYQDGADILAAGHIHYGGLQRVEIPGGHSPWLIRVKGYKCYDPHALVNGFHEGTRFSSVLAIVDPDADAGEHVAVFSSVAQGCEVLTHMREARKKGSSKYGCKVKRAP